MKLYFLRREVTKKERKGKKIEEKKKKGKRTKKPPQDPVNTDGLRESLRDWLTTLSRA